MASILPASSAGATIAAALVVAGAPLFSAGLRSLRLRRHLRGLEPTDLREDAAGFGLFRGRVALESPLFGPLSGKPCAGYRLEVLGARRMRVATLEDLRPFRLVADDVMARVDADHHVSWDLSVVAERV